MPNQRRQIERLRRETLVNSSPGSSCTFINVANEEGVDVGADDDGGRGEEGANVVLAQLHNLQRQGDGHEDGVGEHQRKVTPPDGKDAQRAEENDHEAGVDEHGVVVFQLRLAKVPSANEHKDRADDDEGVGDDEDRFEHIEDRLQGGDYRTVSKVLKVLKLTVELRLKLLLFVRVS
ncbi:hypothetical protein TYRP_012027 [Tyrophagus putrescentiae]|nr:hypothetical protein TYRP_012027 [Tyrophagus putrescentiae]